MAVLTIEEITNLYLYGSETKPLDLTDESLTSRGEDDGAVIERSRNLYMDEVWKNIIVPAQFKVINDFLSGDNPNDFSNGQEYDLDYARSVFGQDANILGLQLADYYDGSEEMRDQIYIWNSASFTLHESIIFKVAADGTRTIQNYAPIPQIDNFDFETSTWYGNIGNAVILEPVIDPQGIGRQVTINFDEEEVPDYFQDLTSSDLSKEAPEAFAGMAFFGKDAHFGLVPELATLISDPAIQIHDGRKVIYGTAGEDELIDSSYWPTSVSYSGLHFVAGPLNDVMYGTTENDFFEGGSGDDTYIFELFYDFGIDVIDDQSNVNSIILDGVLSDKNLNGMTITEVEQDSGVFYELDTNGEIVDGLRFVLSDQLGGGDQLSILVDGGLLGGGTIHIQNFNAANYGLTLDSKDLDDFQPTAPTVTSGADSIGDGIISSIQLKPRILANLDSQARIYDASLYDGNFDTQNTNIYNSGTKEFGGSNFNDLLVGSYFDEQDAGYFEEVLYGFDGDDTIMGESSGASVGDNDHIIGGRGSDYLFGGPGDDEINGNHDSHLQTGQVVFTHNQHFKDVLLVDGSSTENAGDVDFIDGGSGDDSIRAGSGDDFLIGGAGEDSIYGFAGADVIRGGSGVDDIWGDSYAMPDDMLGVNPEVDYDSTAFTNYDDIIYGGSGDDYLIGEYGNDFIDGGADDDYITGDDNPGSTEAHRVIPLELHGDDVIYGGAGEDTVHAGGGNDFVDGGDGADYINGDEGHDTIYGGTGSDFLWGDSEDIEVGGNDIIYGGDGNDQLIGDEIGVLTGGNDSLYGGAGNDSIWGFGGSDVIYGGEGDDILYADVGNEQSPADHESFDQLYGGAGDDSLWGGDGADFIKGGEGFDNFRGQGGWDTYIFDEGDGPISSGAGETLIDSDIELIQINASVSGVIYNSNLDRIQINYGTNDYLLVSVDGFVSAKSLVFDGVEQEITSTSNGDIRYMAGNSDSNELSASIITLTGSHSHNIFVNDGDDRFTLDQNYGDAFSIYLGAGDDILDLQGSGSFTLDGGEGADTIMFGQGSSQHSIDLDQSTDAQDRLLLKGGLSIGDVNLNRSGNNLQLSVVGAPGDELTLNGYFNTGVDQLSKIEFSDGSFFNKESMESYLDTGNHVVGDANDNTLEASESGDVLYGMGGDDTLTVYQSDPNASGPSASGNDVFYGGDGDDLLYSYFGDDTLFGGADDDFIFAGSGNDYLSGGDGDDLLQGGEGNDTLFGGAGNDYMLGNIGYDTYVWGEGNGNDMIYETHLGFGSPNDELLIVGDLTPNDIEWSRDGDELIGEITDTQETITVKNWFWGYGSVLDTIKFETGAVIDGFGLDMDLRYNVIDGSEVSGSTIGTSGEDLILGHGSSGVLSGQAGDDLMYGGDDTENIMFGNDGDDILLGGNGIDFFMSGGDGSDFIDIGLYSGTDSSLQNNLNGGSGIDLYSFSIGFGKASILAGGSHNSSAEDSIQFTDARPEDLWFSQDGDDLVIDVVGYANKLLVEDWYLDDKYEVEHIYTEGFEASNDSVNGIEALVTAMASYDVPSGAGSVVPQSVRDALAPVMANVWQESDRQMVQYY